uniref:Uncharacterized protein n=1 Tax=Knipowitschia caucasica TaxID=637954 RepID=A0AAV2JGA0_KNICA
MTRRHLCQIFTQLNSSSNSDSLSAVYQSPHPHPPLPRVSIEQPSIPSLPPGPSWRLTVSRTGHSAHLHSPYSYLVRRHRRANELFTPSCTQSHLPAASSVTARSHPAALAHISSPRKPSNYEAVTPHLPQTETP